MKIAGDERQDIVNDVFMFINRLAIDMFPDSRIIHWRDEEEIVFQWIWGHTEQRYDDIRAKTYLRVECFVLVLSEFLRMMLKLEEN